MHIGPRDVTIGVQDNTFSALVLIAHAEGFFEQEGLRVRPLHTPTVWDVECGLMP